MTKRINQSLEPWYRKWKTVYNAVEPRPTPEIMPSICEWFVRMLRHGSECMKPIIQHWDWFEPQDPRRTYVWIEGQVEDIIIKRQQESNYMALHGRKGDQRGPKSVAPGAIVGNGEDPRHGVGT